MEKYVLSEERAKETSDGLRKILSYCKIGDEQIIRDAIIEVEKSIPKYVITESWSPNRCPTCWEDLGENCYDGYYENPKYRSCPKCRQRLKYRGYN